MKHPATFLGYFERLTPGMCMAIARWGHGRPRTPGDVAREAGMPVGRVVWIWRQPDFKRVRAEDASNYMLGCGITPRNLSRHLWYIARTKKADWPMAHLFKHRGRTLASIRKALE